MKSLLNLLTLGITTASKALDFIYFGNKRTSGDYSIRELTSIITDSTQSLEKAISFGADKVIDKIEQDKIEELISRINNIDLLLQMKKDDQLFLYVLQLKESVDYAKNRLLEGKENWLMPYMIGLGMVSATFAYLGQQDLSTSETLKKLVKDTKKRILDQVTIALVKEGKEIPWELIKNILENNNNSLEEYINLLPNTPFIQHSIEQEKNVYIAPQSPKNSFSTNSTIRGYYLRCPTCKNNLSVYLNQKDTTCTACGTFINVKARKSEIKYNK